MTIPVVIIIIILFVIIIWYFQTMIIIALLAVVGILVMIAIWNYMSNRSKESGKSVNTSSVIMVKNLDYGDPIYYQVANDKLLKKIDKCNYIFYDNVINKTDVNGNKSIIPHESEEGKFVLYLRHNEFPRYDNQNNIKPDYSVQFSH